MMVPCGMPEQHPVQVRREALPLQGAPAKACGRRVLVLKAAAPTRLNKAVPGQPEMPDGMLPRYPVQVRREALPLQGAPAKACERRVLVSEAAVPARRDKPALGQPTLLDGLLVRYPVQVRREALPLQGAPAPEREPRTLVMAEAAPMLRGKQVLGQRMVRREPRDS